MSEPAMRRLLRSVGVEPRPRGKQLVEIEAPDLVLADWSAGLSCRAIADKHQLASHHYVARFLRSRGIDPTSRPARRKVLGQVLGRRVTDHQSYLRRQPPLVIPMRTAAERRVRRFTAGELEAIA